MDGSRDGVGNPTTFWLAMCTDERIRAGVAALAVRTVARGSSPRSPFLAVGTTKQIEEKAMEALYADGWERRSVIGDRPKRYEVVWYPHGDEHDPGKPETYATEDERAALRKADATGGAVFIRRILRPWKDGRLTIGYEFEEAMGRDYR